MRIAMLIPEFPGQTHAFFWREAAELEKLGDEVRFVTTRWPKRKLMSHDWARGAAQRTAVLYPPGARGLGEGVLGLAAAGPAGWWRVLAEVARADLGLGDRLRLLALVPLAGRLCRWAGRERWDHVHVHSCAQGAHLALLMRRLGGPGYSLTLHGPLGDYGPNQNRKWAGAEFGIVITQHLRREVEEKIGASLPPRLGVAPMGVAVEQFQRDTPYEPWDGQGPLRLFACGRLNRCKGYPDMIRAVALLRGRGLSVSLEIAGEDDAGGEGYRAEVEEAIREQGVGDAVTLLGSVNEGRIREGLTGAHVFVQASVAEALGVSIMEAMAMRTPVVVTRASGAVTELVTDGEDGVVVAPRDPEALAGGIQRVAGDAAGAQRLASAAHRTVSERFHSGVSARVLHELASGGEPSVPEPGSPTAVGGGV